MFWAQTYAKVSELVMGRRGEWRRGYSSPRFARGRAVGVRESSPMTGAEMSFDGFCGLDLPMSMIRQIAHHDVSW